MPIITPRLRLRRSANGRSAFAPRTSTVDRLAELDGVSSNPGNLRARCYVPDGLAPGAPLVVVLHGCTQDAAVYDHGSGWSTLADRYGFALLFPEQQRANNPLLCFNWFSGSDAQRGMGEAASIAAMVEAMNARGGIDPGRIFITGLSAGGAMGVAMLATYPDLFAAGAIIAGIPFGCAKGVGQAFDCMGGRAKSDAAELARQVRRASPHTGPWPRLQVWQGTADSTVVASNAEAIVLQWTQLHGLGEEPDHEDEVEGYPRQRWTGAGGDTLIEQYSITGMAHGVPLAGGGEDRIGAAGAHMFDVGLSSTARIAAFFGIAPEDEAREAPELQAKATPARRLKPEAQTPAAAPAPKAVIEKALKAAGLMR